MNNNFKSYNDLINGALAQYGFDSMQTFIDTAFANRYNNSSWKSAFDWGIPKIGFTYTQLQGTSNVAPKATIIDFDADKPLRAPAGFTLSTGKMPRMGHAIQFNEESFIQEAQILSAYAGSVPQFNEIFNIITNNVNTLLQGVHSQINFMAFQIESTGKFVTNATNNPDGIQGLEFDFNIPALNKKKVVKVWSDVTADPIADLQAMVKYADDNFISYGVFRMNKQTWTTLRDHANVKKNVAIQMNPNIASANIATYSITEANVKAYLEGLGLPPIEIVDEISAVEVYDTATRTIKLNNLRAFADGVVVLRPAGKLGKVECSRPIVLNDPANPIYTYEDGRIAILQSENNRHKIVEMIAELTGLPVINNPKNMIYLDITTAA